MMIKVFTKGKDGKISLTPDELKKLLDEAYWDGYSSNNSWTYRSPSPSITTPYVWGGTSPSITTPYVWSGTSDSKITLSNVYGATATSANDDAADPGAGAGQSHGHIAAVLDHRWAVRLVARGKNPCGRN